jgi:LysM repeat protein
MFQIAQRFGTTVERIARANNISNPNLISVGQVLIIPEDGATGGSDNTMGINDTVGTGTPTGGGANEVSRRVDSLLYTIYTNKRTYALGENVSITLVKTNRSNRNITLRYNTAQRFDFVARRVATQEEIWRWSRGRFFAQRVADITLRPGQSQVFRVTWDQRNNQGRQIAAGNITIQGFNVARGLQNQAVSTTIRVQGVSPTPTPRPTVSPTPCPNINVLANPGFENWPNPASLPNGWTGSNLYRTTISHRGNYAAELGAVHNRAATLLQRADIEPGRIYDLVWWARENVQAGGTARFVLFVEILYYNRSGQFVGRTEPRYTQDNIPNNSYQRYSLSTGRVPTGARIAEVRFTFEPSSNNDNTVKIDDVDLRCIF